MISKPSLINNLFFKDNRGHFSKIAHKEFFVKKKYGVRQFNISYSKRLGTIRGMHLQKEKYPEVKIVTCLKGKIYDVIIDCRKYSKTFKKKFIFRLNNFKKSLIVPEGFAHGFQTLTNDCIVVYLHTNFYKPEYEETINPLKLDIEWPLKNIIISKKDKNSKKIL